LIKHRIYFPPSKCLFLKRIKLAKIKDLGMIFFNVVIILHFSDDKIENIEKNIHDQNQIGPHQFNFLFFGFCTKKIGASERLDNFEIKNIEIRKC
jgi:hypothetical protein